MNLIKRKLNRNERELYKCFLESLPEDLHAATTINGLILSDRLPAVTTEEGLLATVNALESSFADCLPEEANPFKLALSVSPVILDGVGYLYSASLAFLAVYVPGSENTFGELAKFLLFHSEKPNELSSVDLLIEQINLGYSTGRSPLTGMSYERPSTLQNQSTKEYVKDYARNEDGELPEDTSDLAVSYYRKYKKVVAELRDLGEEVSIVELCRIPFSYIGTTERVIKKSHLQGEELSVMNSDLLKVKINKLRKQYENAFYKGSLELDLYKRLRIEAFFKFLDNPNAPETQKKKYFSMLSAYIDGLVWPTFNASGSPDFNGRSKELDEKSAAKTAVKEAHHE